MDGFSTPPPYEVWKPAGFKGGFFDGRYVYYVPFRGDVPACSNKSPFHGNYLRYDTTLPLRRSH